MQTKEEVYTYIKETIKCTKDPVYFLNTYGYVYDVSKKKVDRLKCYPYQEDIVKKFEKNQNNIVLKSRQLGLSVITAGYVAWTLLFKEDQRILIVANDGAAAVRFLSGVKQFLQYLPKMFFDPIKHEGKNNEKFLSIKCGVDTNGKPKENWVKAVASSKQAGRGESLTMLILDETAFIENADDIWMGAGLALTATEGKCIMISTPYGTGNLYHTTWVESTKTNGDQNYTIRKNDSGSTTAATFYGTTIHWTEHPFYSEGKELRKDEFGRTYWWSPWYEGECKRFNYDRIKIAQELDLSFEGSRALVVDSTILTQYKQEILTKPGPVCYYDYTAKANPFVNDVVTNFFIWEKPKEGANYIIAADVGRGDKSDFSTIQIIDADALVQVAEYQGKIPPDLFAHMIYRVALDYNNAYVAIECNSFGLATCLVLKNQLRYNSSRIYHSKSIKKMVNHHWNFSVDESEEIPGFQTTQRTRPLIINSLTTNMREHAIKLSSNRLMEEFDTFIYNDKQKPEHAPGYHDDLIIALAIALYIRDTEFNNVFISKDFYKAMLDSMSFGKSDGSKYSSVEPSKNNGIQTTNNNPINDDLSWLYGKI